MKMEALGEDVAHQLEEILQVAVCLSIARPRSHSDLCSWGERVRDELEATDMFVNSSCPDQHSSDTANFNKGPVLGLFIVWVGEQNDMLM
jgi:hypothetical protein